MLWHVPLRLGTAATVRQVEAGCVPVRCDRVRQERQGAFSRRGARPIVAGKVS